MFDYPVTQTPDDGTVLITFADVPEAIMFGADTEQALMHAVGALQTAMSFYPPRGRCVAGHYARQVR